MRHNSNPSIILAKFPLTLVKLRWHFTGPPRFRKAQGLVWHLHFSQTHCSVSLLPLLFPQVFAYPSLLSAGSLRPPCLAFQLAIYVLIIDQWRLLDVFIMVLHTTMLFPGTTVHLSIGNQWHAKDFPFLKMLEVGYSITD